MIGIGIIGTGFGRQVHIPAFRLVKGVKIIGVSSARYSNAFNVAKQFSLPRIFQNWQELIRCPEIHAVAISTPPYLHYEMAMTAIRSGKSVLCEKPMAKTAFEARSMMVAAKKAGVACVIGFEFRELPAFRRVHQWLTERRLGDIRHVNVKWVVPNWSDPKRPWSWRSEVHLGGGVLGALAVHSFDYIQWLLGPFRSVSAILDTKVNRRLDPNGKSKKVTAEDSCQIIGRLKSGATLTLDVSMAGSISRGHWIEIHGEKGFLLIGSESDNYGKGFRLWHSASRFEKPELVSLPNLPYENYNEDGRIAPFVPLVKRFIEAVKKKSGLVQPSFEDGWKSQMILDAVRKSYRDRKCIDVPSYAE